MPDNQTGKYPKKSISFPEDLLERAMERKGERSLSGYIQTLIAHDLDGGDPDPLSGDIILRLTEDLWGKRFAARMEAQLEDARSQPDELAAWLMDRLLWMEAGRPGEWSPYVSEEFSEETGILFGEPPKKRRGEARRGDTAAQ